MLSVRSEDSAVKPILFDSLLDVVTLILSTKYFAKDYFSKYPLSADIEHLKANAWTTGFHDVDDSRIRYLLNECRNIEASSSSHDVSSRSQLSHPNEDPTPAALNARIRYLLNGSRNNEASSSAPEVSSRSQLSHPNGGPTPAAAAATPAVASAGTGKRNRKPKRDKKTEAEGDEVPSNSAGGGIKEVELLSLISGVKDILPDYGDGYIEACLEKFAFSQELTLNALLTNDLPSDILSLDPKLTREARREAGERQRLPLPDVIASRRNIYDGDEFDIHRNQTIDLDRVHVGKKDRKIDTNADADLRKRTLLMQERMLKEEEEEELAVLAEMGITDPADLYVG